MSNPVRRLRKRAIRYYLARAKGPSAQRFAEDCRRFEQDAETRLRKCRISELPRPSAVDSLRRCRAEVAIVLALLTASITFIVCYCRLPALRIWLGDVEPVACSTAVVTLLVTGVLFAFTTYKLCRLYYDAYRYVVFVTAMVNQQGHFVPKEDSDYAEYIDMFGPIILTQREFYEWFVNGKAPIREVPADLRVTSTIPASL